MRERISLMDDWRFVEKAANAQQASQAKGESVCLPHTWNARDRQDGGNDYARGTRWYVRCVTAPDCPANSEIWLECTGAAMTAEVFWNGKKLTRHEGGYSTFRVELTPYMEPKNLLVIAVDNNTSDRIYPQKADFTFYGGLYREVSLICVPATHFSLDRNGGPGLRLTPTVDLDDHTATVTVETWVTSGEGQTVTFSLAGQTQYAQVASGYASSVFTIPHVCLWDGLDDPYLYTATASLASGDVIAERFGCRTFDIDPQKGFYLNGRPYPLRGVSRHQDRKDVGNAITPAMMREDMSIIRELGANTLRLAHYQHAQEFYDLCDENGLLVWAEIPYISQHMPDGNENIRQQMRELVEQNYNHPCICCWGLSNEITASGAVSENLLANHRTLNELCHTLDSTRPTAMANVFMLEPDSPLLEIPNLNSYNLYYGWYLGECAEAGQFLDDYHAKYPQRCLGLSEYGADANPRYQSAAPRRGDYTESYQALYHEQMLDIIEARPWLWATHAWNLFDFAADGRDEGGKPGENQKGLVTFDRLIKKDAFYLYKAHWSKEPFVHICGSRYVNRTEDTTEIKVYSNQPEIVLIVDGKVFARQKGRYIFRFYVPICGEHHIAARAGGLSSVIYLCKVKQPDPTYQYAGASTVVNWFDKDDKYDPACYSLTDTIGELMREPRAAAIVQKVIGAAASTRGEVGSTAAVNPNLQRMLMRQTLQSILSHVSDKVSKAQIQTFNRELQAIKKPYLGKENDE